MMAKERSWHEISEILETISLEKTLYWIVYREQKEVKDSQDSSRHVVGVWIR